jgi:Pvc16 N-terminal domain
VLSSEEISKLWTAFGAHYRPTAGYQATVVLIEGRRPTKSALPVKDRRLYALTIREPRIDAVDSDAGPGVPIVATSKLVLSGRRLVGQATEVVVSGQLATIESATEEQIVADQPAGLRAGVQAVQVKHRVLMGDPPPGTPHRGFESNVAAFVLRPTYGGLTFSPPLGGGATPYTGTATVAVTPGAGRAQHIVLLLNSRTTTPAHSYAFVANPRTSDVAPIEVPLEDVERGDYFVRVQVDGAESPVDLDWATSTTKVTI